MSLTIPSFSIVPQWRRPLAVFTLLLLAVLLLYSETGLAMVGIWERSETFAHAFVVPPISLWLIWRQRASLALLAPRPAPWFLLPMAAVGLLWLLGELAAVNAATQFALVGMLVLLVPVVLGWPVARCIAFPLGFLFFAVPFGEFVMPQLMEWTAHFTVAALRASGIPVYQEGLQFIIPTGNWSVVEACSGIRYLMASVMVGTLFAYLNYRSMTRRWIFVVFSAVLPLAANWLRAYMIVMLGHLSGNKIATGADHLVYGWVLFGIIMLVMFMVGARWAEPDAPQPTADHSPVFSTSTSSPWPALVAVAFLVASPGLFVRQLNAQPHAVMAALNAPDLTASGWLQAGMPVSTFKPHFENPVATLEAGYRAASSAADGAAVGVYIGYYRQQNYDSKLISSNNVIVTSHDPVWKRISDGQVTDEQGRVLQTAELRGVALGDETATGRLRVWETYWVNGHVTASDWQAKLLGALGRLIGQGDASAVIVLYALKPVAGQNDALLAEFWRSNQAPLTAWLAQIGPQADGQSSETLNKQGTSR